MLLLCLIIIFPFNEVCCFYQLILAFACVCFAAQDAHLDDDEYLAEQIVEAYLKTAERLVKRNAQMPVPTIPGDEYEEESDDEEVHE